MSNNELKEDFELLKEEFELLRYKKLYDDVEDLGFATDQASCFDLRAYFSKGIASVIIKPMQRMLIPTGIVFDIPKGFSVRLHPRSGLAIKNGISLINCEGVVDSDYTNEIMIPIINFGTKDFKIKKGDRIAQGEMIEDLKYIIFETGEEITKKGNRTGGFGSTGVK